MSAINPINWQKSSFSGGGGENCIEVATHEGSIVMRESDDPSSTITTSRAKMAAFIAGMKNGEFDHLVN
ncbi:MULTISPECIES: DUF397 domain-containing protein [Streptomyces]|uniref:DUF397 domain-containing protein n=2 Tax=Streptomyces rimosus subsp. rimosus TaxID=132474 RepID=L8ERJ9_STRR1|nr:MULTISPECIES: DUF397 domain-containing protein [Streptomyces]KOG67094.1 hypothetical protein ADK78_41905 [Kitasatospora aureofaciens]MYT44421.1 DUF397 domain-containing protein [Streptomyces sp. SID5471]KUJ42189.1 hypothetical protein ADK46_04365 [Streptomyces rimosus subsp. rimosus]QDA05503.1 DUF397 domain-containing protein [Streptomyces rimosus]QEV76786.1 DUF397 domain-containing protein [Streptomyces rimosus]